MSTTRRKSVPLSDAARKRLGSLRAMRPADGTSESALLGEAVERGLAIMQEEALAEAYAAYAEWAENDPEEQAVGRVLRARRNRGPDDDGRVLA